MAQDMLLNRLEEWIPDTNLKKLPDEFKDFSLGMLTREELDSCIAQTGCLPVELEQIPWNQI